MASRWRCPPERFAPPSDTGASSPPASRAKPSRRQRDSASHNSPSSAEGRAISRFERIVPLNR